MEGYSEGRLKGLFPFRVVPFSFRSRSLCIDSDIMNRMCYQYVPIVYWSLLYKKNGGLGFQVLWPLCGRVIVAWTGNKRDRWISADDVRWMTRMTLDIKYQVITMA